jgi:tetratricopeptide (TPR) repeat protein
MSSSWLLWLILSWLTGSPVTAALVLLAIWFVGDRASFRLLPDPLRAWRRFSRRGDLERTLSANPSDRRARFELASLLLDARRPARALEVLRPNLEAGDDDVHTAFLYGVLLERTGQRAQAERILSLARGQEPEYRLGEIDLELGRNRLGAGDLAGAREALERLVSTRPGTVQGRWLLAKALEGLGDAAGAERRRAEAWREYAALPRFKRAEERPWAWRIKPWRPAVIGCLVLAVIVAAALAVARAPAPTSPREDLRELERE